MIMDCEARNFTAQCYTKNRFRAWMMGMCNFKTNLSLMFLVNKNGNAAMAGLDENGDYLVADYAGVSKNGTDQSWRTDPTKQTQSFGLRTRRRS